MGKMPFQIDRTLHRDLTTQVEQGLRRAVLDGVYRTDDQLPSLLKMSAQLGVSEIIIRRAVRRLADEGLVKGWARRGVRVCDVRRRPWRATVLYLHWSGPTMYYHSLLSATVGERLQDERVLMLQTLVTGSDAATGFGKAQTLLDTQSPTLVLIEGSAERLDRHLEQRCIPFLHMSYDSELSPLAVGRIESSWGETAMAAVAGHARLCGIRTALLICMTTPSSTLRPALAAAGIAATELPMTPVPELGAPGGMEAGALRALDAYLDAGRPLPDLIYFGDDFAARGGLVALTARGVRIPEDVQVISWANKGLGPIFLRPLTRVEMDPVRHGGQVAGAVLRQLLQTDGDAHLKIRLEPDFVVGETTHGVKHGKGPSRIGLRSAYSKKTRQHKEQYR